MSDYIEIYSLDGCGYSFMAENSLINNKINHKVIKVSWSESSKYKKQNDMRTFPQIFYVNKGKRVKIGGSNDLEYLLNFNKELKENRKDWDNLLDNNKLNIDRSSLVKILYLINRKKKVI